MDADRVIVELIAKVGDFDGKMKQSAVTFEQSISKISASATKAEGTVAASTKRMSTAVLQSSTALGTTMAQTATKFDASTIKIGASATKAGSAVSLSSRLMAASISKDAAGVEHLAQIIEKFERRKAAALSVASAITSAGIGETKKITAATVAATTQVVQADNTKTKTVVANTAKVVTAQAAQGTAAVKAATLMRTSFVDVGQFLQSNKSPFVIAAKQAPISARAFGLVTAAGSALGAVMGSLVVQGVLAAAAALAKLVLDGNSAKAMIDDMVEKLKEDAKKTAAAREAKAIYSRTLEGVTEAIRANRDAIKELNRANEGAAERATKDAALNLVIIESIQAETQARIDQARAILEVQRARASGPGQSAELAALDLPRRQATLDALEKSAEAAKIQLGLARGAFNELFKSAVVERAERLSDPLKEIAERYKGMIDQTKKLATVEEARNGTLDRQVKALKAKQKAEEDAHRASQRTDNSNRQSGRQINEAQARAIVASVGGTVTSGTRTAKHNEDVGGVPNSSHVKGQALDIAKTAGLTLGKIVKAFEKAGVHLIEKLDEGDHFHIAFGKRGGQGPSEETLAKRALAAADAAERREQAYQNAKAELDGQVIDARQALITSAEEIAKLESEAIEVSRQKYNDNLDSMVKQRKLSTEEAAELQKLNDERAKLRTELVGRREAERKFRMQEAAAQRAVEFQLGSKQVEQDFIQSQEGLAMTARARRDQEQRLLDLQFEMERIQLQAIIAEAERLRVKENLTDLEQAELERANDRALVAAQQLGTLDARQANAQQGSAEANQSPLQSFFGDIPNTADEINEAFESIAAGGLATFTDALTNAIVNFTSLKDVARATLQSIVAGLIKMGIQQLILATVGQTVGAATAGVVSGQMAIIAAAAAPAAALVSLATSGANAIPAQGALASTAALSTAISLSGRKGFRSGGYTGDGPTGSPAGLVHGKEFVFDAASTRRIGVPALEAMRSGAVRPSNAVAVAPRGSGGAELSSDAVSKLGGIVREAIGAMPPIQLFPTFDPSAALRAALNSSEGRQWMAEFMAENSNMMNGSLGQ